MQKHYTWLFLIAALLTTPFAHGQLNSYPQALAEGGGCIYLDFDGHSLPAGSAWNNHLAYTAAASGLDAATVKLIYESVREDFIPFNVTVTTDAGIYNTFIPNRRIRCIISPSSLTTIGIEAKNAGHPNDPDIYGNAITSSYGQIDPLCWIFTTNTYQNCADVISHELGHVFGLQHRNLPGGGIFNSATRWGPIMGAGGHAILHWSDGEYECLRGEERVADPVERQSDLLTIGDAIVAQCNDPNETSYRWRNPLEETYDPTPLTRTGNQLQGSGVIRQHGLRGPDDVYNFTFAIYERQRVRLTIKSIFRGSLTNQAVRRYGNIRLHATLFTPYRQYHIPIDYSAGPEPTDQDVIIDENLAPGTYRLRVKGEAYNRAVWYNLRGVRWADIFDDPILNDNRGNYSEYGSIGSFKVEGLLGEILPSRCALLYNRAAYLGVPMLISSGSYTMNDLKAIGIEQHEIRSLKVVPGYEIEVYDQDNCNGPSLVLFADDDDLSNNPFSTADPTGWDRHITSIAMRKERGATVYSNGNYGSAPLAIPRGAYNQESLTRFGLDSAALSSLQVRPGYEIQLFSGDEFKGYSIVLTADLPNLATKVFPTAGTWDNRARSIIVRKIGTPVVTAFNDCNNFTTTPIPFTEGRYTAKDLLARGLAFKTLSSLKVTAGYEAVLYASDTFQGASLSLTANTPCLTANPLPGGPNWNDKTASLIVRKYQAPVVTLYNNCNNFTTTPVPLTEGFYTVADLKDRGLDSGQLSSLKITPGYEAVLYTGNYLTGHSVRLTSDALCLTNNTFPGGGTWNDKTSSLQVRALPKAVAWMYAALNYSNGPAGPSPLPVGDYDLSELNRRGIGNDALSSIKVDSGYEMVLYQNDNFSGDSLILAANTPSLDYFTLQSSTGNWLGASSWDNQTSSLRVRTATTGAPKAWAYPSNTFQGLEVALAPGTYSMAALKARGLNNDALRALRLAPGYGATLYENDNFDGTPLMLQTDTTRLAQYKLNGSPTINWEAQTTSLKIYAVEHLPVATLYGASGYGGAVAALSPGDYYPVSFFTRGLPMTGPAAVRVKAGYEAILYSNTNPGSPGGDSLIVPSGANLANLGAFSRPNGSSWSGYVSSVRIRSARPDQAIGYSDCSYGGVSARLPEGSYPVAMLQGLNLQSQALSSLRVAGGYEAVLYQNDAFSGDSLTLRGDQSCLVSQGWNDKAASLRIRPMAPVAATLYPNCNYGGTELKLPEGTYNLSALQAKGFDNDQLSSLKVDTNYEALLYQHDYLSGPVFKVIGSMICLATTYYTGSTTGVDDQTTSMIIRRRIGPAGASRKAGPQDQESGAIEALELSAQPSVYPNPVTDRLYVRLAAASASVVSYQILDAMGRTVLVGTQLEGPGQSVDVSRLPVGLYVLRLQFAGAQAPVVLPFTKQ
ncbi:MAG: T9SS type A sorting domain-containing protein [Sphingobacteriales bacterium]|nr:MAG: T9SS type A sorting domain-containing protein [Sphingobacteriales bacterium]